MLLRLTDDIMNAKVKECALTCYSFELIKHAYRCMCARAQNDSPSNVC